MQHPKQELDIPRFPHPGRSGANLDRASSQDLFRGNYAWLRAGQSRYPSNGTFSSLSRAPKSAPDSHYRPRVPNDRSGSQVPRLPTEDEKQRVVRAVRSLGLKDFQDNPDCCYALAVYTYIGMRKILCRALASEQDREDLNLERAAYDDIEAEVEAAMKRGGGDGSEGGNSEDVSNEDVGRSKEVEEAWSDRVKDGLKRIYHHVSVLLHQ